MFLGFAIFAAASPALAAIRNVDCTKGETITTALTDAVPGDTIRVTGTCREKITITTDRLTLDGQGKTILDGGGGGPTELTGLVTIDGARGVTITGVTIQNGPGDGILAIHAATFAVKSTTLQGHGFMGIDVTDHSTAELDDVTMQRNQQGIDVVNASLVILRGRIIIRDNRSHGADVNGGSVMEIRGAHVEVSNNDFGVAAADGRLVVYAFTASRGSTITASHNRGAAIGIGTSVFSIFGPVTITAENNGFGLFCPAGGKLLDPFGGSVTKLRVLAPSARMPVPLF